MSKDLGQVSWRRIKYLHLQIRFPHAVLNGFQHAGMDDSDKLYYDWPAWSPLTSSFCFWSLLKSIFQELSLSVYLHPVAPADYLFEKQYKGRKYLIGPPLSFANDISLHFFGMIKNDVFDRFLKLKVITGHLGEHILFYFWRINRWFEDIAKLNGKAAKKTITKNIWVTTSGCT